MRTLAIEIYKTINDINPSYMKNLFKVRETNRLVREPYKHNLEIQSYNQASFGRKSLKTLGPKVWNSLPFHIKSAESLDLFKKAIKNWDGISCNCANCHMS